MIVVLVEFLPDALPVGVAEVPHKVGGDCPSLSLTRLEWNVVVIHNLGGWGDRRRKLRL